MPEWSKDHVVAIDSLNSTLVLLVELGKTGDRGGSLRWKVKTVGWEGQGVVCGKPTHLRL
jgi:hypothetical protein